MAKTPKGGKAGKGAGASGGKGKKGRGKGKGGDQQIAVPVRGAARSAGVPFTIVLYVAVAMCIPTLLAWFDGAANVTVVMLRLLGALAVSWVVCSLVHGVVQSFKPKPKVTIVTVEQPPRGVTGPVQPVPGGGGGGGMPGAGAQGGAAGMGGAPGLGGELPTVQGVDDGLPLTQGIETPISERAPE